MSPVFIYRQFILAVFGIIGKITLYLCFTMTISIRPSIKAKRVRLVVREDGRCEVVVPARRAPSEHQIHQFIEKHREWIEQQIQRRKQQLPRTSLTHKGVPAQLVKRNSRDLVITYLNTLPTEFGVRTFTFKSFRSQWGSCSSAGTIALNYKLSLLPLSLAHYIIAHELCHLSHMNHSRAFWKAVKELCPAHVACRKALRKYLP